METRLSFRLSRPLSRFPGLLFTGATMASQPKTSPRICALPSELENSIRSLTDLACCGAVPTLPSWVPNVHLMMADPDARRAYFQAAHEGFRQAQTHVIECMVGDGIETTTRIPGMVCRKIMDTIAWQLLSKQLYLARRLYLGQPPPRLTRSEIDVLTRSADHVTGEIGQRFALISDLTSFVQVGDLLVIDPDAGLTLAEVKTGTVNRRILEFMESYLESQDQATLRHFCEREGKKTFLQLGRILRQGARLESVVNIINSGSGWDIDLDREVVIPEEALSVNSYDDCLAVLLEDSRKRGWAIECINDCLFIGVYRNEKQKAGPIAFSSWFASCGGRPQFPQANLLECMTIPLALPIFSRDIPRESMFDLLFGRTSVFFAIDLNVFAKLCNLAGLCVRWPTRKEAARLLASATKDFRPWGMARRGLVLDRHGSIEAIADGLFDRIFFHGTTPASAVQIIERLIACKGKRSVGDSVRGAPHLEDGTTQPSHLGPRLGPRGGRNKPKG